jgi:hypothetical protein
VEIDVEAHDEHTAKLLVECIVDLMVDSGEAETAEEFTARRPAAARDVADYGGFGVVGVVFGQVFVYPIPEF